MTLPTPQHPRPETPPARRRFGLTPRQSLGLALLGLGIASLVLLRLSTQPRAFPDPLPPFPAGFDRLADRIDPNLADAGELAVLPSIGPSKADGIISYREERRLQGHWPVFERVEDLAQVYGIGPALVEKMRPYVIFEEKKRGATELGDPAGN